MPETKSYTKGGLIVSEQDADGTRAISTDLSHVIRLTRAEQAWLSSVLSETCRKEGQT